MSSCIRIAVVDRDPIYRMGIVEALKTIEQIVVVAQGATADDAVRICMDASPNIIFLGIRIQGGGISATRTISAANPEIRIIILTSLEGGDYVRSALQAGAHAYILKSIAGPQLVDTVHAVRRGETLVSPTLAARLLSGASNAGDLDMCVTHREMQVLKGVGGGLTNKEVARELGLSEKTVKHYMSIIMEKLQVRNRVEAAILARQIKP